MPNTESLFSAICLLQQNKTLSSTAIANAFRVIMRGDASDGAIGAFLGILATRVPTGEELFGASTVMRECVEGVEFPNPENLLDTCGTGGAPKTFNVSTAAGIVAAACGVRVTKHGNRSRTGRGSAEVLKQLGVNIEASVEQQKRCLKEVGICFCFAPKHHKSVAHVMPVRKELGFPTIFNLLGPLTNPCSAGRQLLGVWDDRYVKPMADALLEHKTTKSVVVHSHDGLDEISISAPTRMLFISNGELVEEVVKPESVGLRTWNINEVTALNLSEATRFVEDVVIEGRSGAVRDMVVMSAATSLFIADRVSELQEGVLMASDSIDSGATKDTLDAWIDISNSDISSTEQ